LAIVATLVVSIPSLGLRLEGGSGLPLSSPQSAYFGLGACGALSADVALLRALDVGLQVGYARFEKKAASPTAGAGTLLTVGVGTRFHRPLDNARLIPWGEAVVNWGFSGGSRLPLSLAAGLSYRLGDSSSWLVGLYSRLIYVLALGDNDPGFTTYNATLLSFGLSLEYRYATSRGGEAFVTEGAEPVRSADADQDGIDDTADKCPEQSGTAPDGCPKKSALSGGTKGDADGDGDSIVDDVDACPLVAGTSEMKGCPDTDGDFVSDADDACPNVAGKASGGGCPSYKKIVVNKDKLELKQKVQFIKKSAKLSPGSNLLLDEVGQAIFDRPDHCVRIESHTDNKGTRDANLSLSGSQANAVRDYLVRQGIAINRLGAQGFADKRPIASNKTANGRAANWRIEFVFVPCTPESP
jgi:outer membrane protein OmpA-like peptidoglycan-associated protein